MSKPEKLLAKLNNLMEQKVYFQNSKGSKLCEILSILNNDKTKPIVILVHGFSSNKNTKNFILLRHLLENKGISTFRFDIYGHGESEGKLENITISEGVDDVFQSINYLKQQGYNKIGLVGSSFGGISSLIASAKTNDLFVLALKSPVSNYEEFYKKATTFEEIKDWQKKGYTYRKDDGNGLKINYSFYKEQITPIQIQKI